MELMKKPIDIQVKAGIYDCGVLQYPLNLFCVPKKDSTEVRMIKDLCERNSNIIKNRTLIFSQAMIVQLVSEAD